MLQLDYRNAGPIHGWDWRDSSRKPRPHFHTSPKRDLNPGRSAIKRVLDVAGAVLLLLALAPVMAILALMVGRDGGPVFFRHNRIGADGRVFGCLKFRSMCVDSDKRLKDLLARDPAARAEWDKDFKLRNDPRVTRLGDIMRKTSLDELPQLFNVLRGEMSLVGPRPIVSAEVPRYGQHIEEYKKCRPGLTGLWQVSGRNDVDYPTRVRLDTEYVRTWHPMNDIAILFKTVGVVFKRAGAY